MIAKSLFSYLPADPWREPALEAPFDLPWFFFFLEPKRKATTTKATFSGLKKASTIFVPFWNIFNPSQNDANSTKGSTNNCTTTSLLLFILVSTSEFVLLRKFGLEKKRCFRVKLRSGELEFQNSQLCHKRWNEHQKSSPPVPLLLVLCAFFRSPLFFNQKSLEKSEGPKLFHLF